ncbi:ferritin-like domain-containing protein [Bradyrhizobium sp. CCBAU 51753]|uniref:ferritin-like domain-containing protein n=1 Tax=Bradyrhizobium sp. CCBAU 51753 TaxID=1325100 RepID=UPI00188A9970|nr:ferritin-like domain-containing protein [Bradyrhizobium sp. CCBAU 51753]QOZ27791.1 hypothetical protein XH93_32390 [Bradyrhizobium sp. CCBAU 51753]
MDNGSGKIFPRNLTARAAYQVPGNPVVTRLEDVVANCYPGLELDVRNFDRRFFPGLVFEFVARLDNTASYEEPERYGAWLHYVDVLMDPDVQSEAPEVKKLRIDLLLNAGALGAHDDWYLEWVEQKGKRLSMRHHNPDNPDYPLDGLYVWRLLRGLEPGPLTIGLRRRSGDHSEIVLEGWRRNFVDPVTGVISGAYQPGELLQSLCSPWQHDFRDCSCMYWAANHPDVVFQEVGPDDEKLPNGQAADPLLANLRVDWLRSDRARDATAAAENTIAKNRPYQFDHFQINQEWQRLNVVVRDQEIDQVYAPLPDKDKAKPFDTPEELAKELREKLGPMEMALALEYVYARFSLLSPEQADQSGWPTMRDDVAFIRGVLMIIASCEMQHLRWVNELLWILHNAKLISSYAPVLHPAKTLPDGKRGWRNAVLSPLTPDTLTRFIDIERPSGVLDGAYARVIATLRLPIYPKLAIELAERIDSDGIDHYSKFCEVEVALKTYRRANPALPYLRKVEVGTPNEAKDALKVYHDILRLLGNGYTDYARDQLEEGAPFVMAARAKMNELLTVGEALALRGIGIPFW